MKVINHNGYIVGYSETVGEDVTASEWESIRSAIEKRPAPEEGYQAFLKAFDLTWETVANHEYTEEHPQTEEISNGEAFDIIFGGGE